MKVHIWDAKRGMKVGELGKGDMTMGHIGIVNEVIWNTAESIVSTSDDFSVIVWNLVRD
jgi:hypothetical protein